MTSTLSDLNEVLKGGKGSGNFGHKGRPGKRGGSSSGSGGKGGVGGGRVVETSFTEADKQDFVDGVKGKVQVLSTGNVLARGRAVEFFTHRGQLYTAKWDNNAGQSIAQGRRPFDDMAAAKKDAIEFFNKPKNVNQLSS